MRTVLLAMACAMSCSAQEITFTNFSATFTNNEGRIFSNVTLSKADLDGVIWRSEASAGRISFTNLSAELLTAWRIPTNRIQIASERAAKRAATAKREHLEMVQAAIAAKIEIERAESEKANTDRLEEAKKEQQEKLEQITRLRADISWHKQVRDRAWDRYKYTRKDAFSVTANSRGGAVADTAATRRATVRAQDEELRQHKELLKDLGAAYREKYREHPRPTLP
jgi:hypothetical protein